MDQHQVQEIADSLHLDVRPVQEYHYRLMDEWGKYIVDVYFKRNKQGRIVRNTTFHFRTQKWGQVWNEKDLIKLIKL